MNKLDVESCRPPAQTFGAICPGMACNYPEGDCLGACALGGPLSSRQAHREHDSLDAAVWCALGAAATLAGGACFALVKAMARGWGIF